jgi:hypothetical protein
MAAVSTIVQVIVPALAEIAPATMNPIARTATKISFFIFATSWLRD